MGWDLGWLFGKWEDRVKDAAEPYLPNNLPENNDVVDTYPIKNDATMNALQQLEIGIKQDSYKETIVVNASTEVASDGNLIVTTQRTDNSAPTLSSTMLNIGAGAGNIWDSVTTNIHFKKDFEEGGEKYKYQLMLGDMG